LDNQIVAPGRGRPPKLADLVVGHPDFERPAFLAFLSHTVRYDKTAQKIQGLIQRRERRRPDSADSVGPVV